MFFEPVKMLYYPSCAFNNCVITAEEGCTGASYLLARPWGANAYITWINCYMGEIINKYDPYGDMSGNMANIYQFKDYANYMIASPNNIAGMGMNYVDMIKSFKKTSTIEAIGKQLINDFRAYYTWSASEWNKYCKELSEIAGTTLTPQQIQFYSMLGISTLSMIDLTKIDDLENSITELSQFILNNKSKNLSGLYYDESGNVVNEESANTTPIPYIDLLKDYVRMSSLTGNSLYYMGTYSWLFDIGYMIDTFTYVASVINTFLQLLQLLIRANRDRD